MKFKLEIDLLQPKSTDMKINNYSIHTLPAAQLYFFLSFVRPGKHPYLVFGTWVRDQVGGQRARATKEGWATACIPSGGRERWRIDLECIVHTLRSALHHPFLNENRTKPIYISVDDIDL